MAKLTSLGTRVTGSMVGGKIAAAFKSGDAKAESMRKLHEKNAERVVETLGQLKGAAMKIGQTVALMGKELPPEAQAVYRKLFDAAPPVPFEIVREEIEKSLEGTLEELFGEFDPEPIGAASLAQAHSARLPDGTPVIVKVLYRGIDKSMDADLKTLKTAIASGRLFARSKKELDSVFQEMRTRLLEELDYRHEASNIEAFQSMPSRVAGLTVPRTHGSHSTERVLTMDRLSGINFESFLEIATPEAKQHAGDILVRLCMEMMFKMRMLHADPHGGNFLFTPEGNIGLIDYGCVRFFDKDLVTAFARLDKGVLTGDNDLLLQGARELGVLNTDKQGAVDLLLEAVQPLSKILGGATYVAGTAEGAISEEWKKLGPKFLRYPGLQYPGKLVYLDRTFGGIYGMLRRMRHEAPYGSMLLEYAEHAIAVGEGRADDVAVEVDLIGGVVEPAAEDRAQV